MKYVLIALATLYTSTSLAQISSFPYKESFDNVTPPNLPPGWTTTINRNFNGDFTTSTTSVRSSPNAISSTDATKSQSIISPLFDLTGRTVDTLEFYERRTSTHLARVLVEASINTDSVFGIRISPDSLRFVSGTSYIRRAFSLPDTLSGKSGVRFRIRIISDTIGGSGVYRIDDVRLTTKKSFDLAVTSCSTAPAIPKQGDDVTLKIGIQNRARAGLASGTVQVYDSLILISSKNFSHTFAASESLTISLSYANIKSGRHPLTAVLQLNGDEDTTNNSFSVVVVSGYRQRTMLINEFMYTPSTGMPEWIEIVNNGVDTIPLSGWKISDAGATKSSIFPGNRFIPPYSYFIITTDTTAFKDIYDISVPLFQSSFSALNNSGDAVILYDHNNSMIDSVAYLSSWGGSTGRSLERIDTAIASTVQVNWSSSKHPAGATPGTINSVTKKTFDAAVTRMAASPPFPIAGSSFVVTSVIKNSGKQAIANVNFRLYIDANKDSILSETEYYGQKIIPLLNADDSVLLQMNIGSLPQGSHWIFAKISMEQDDDTTNNMLLFPVTVGLQAQSIVITEIMYAPVGDMPEWIEGYNGTSSAINIGGWKISDNGSTKAPLQSKEPVVPPFSYFIVTTDTAQLKSLYPSYASPMFQAAIPALNNSTPDAVVLFDERNAVMDSVYYKPTWGGTNGNSLQRFDIRSVSSDSMNWRSTFPSAGYENGIARKDFDVELKRIVVTNQPNGAAIAATIFNTGRQQANSLTMNFFHDINGDSIGQREELLSSAVLAPVLPMDSVCETFFWNANPEGRQHIIVQTDFPEDERRNDNISFTTVTKNYPAQSIVINEIMYEPQSGSAEFVELLNRSADTIDVSDWKLMDQPTSAGSRSMITLAHSPLPIPPNGYILVASDSSIYTQFPALRNSPVILHPSLSLSNNGEDLVLVDLSYTQIDSVRYSPLWHLKNITTAGRSLERIDPSVSSNDQRNWSSSVDQSGSSPERKNSIFIGSVSSSSSISLSPNPFSPDQDGFEDFLSIHYVLANTSSMIRIRIFDVTGRLVRRLAMNEPSASSGTILWNGFDDDGHRVRIGMYIILLEALNNFGGVASVMKDVAVVGRKL